MVNNGAKGCDNRKWSEFSAIITTKNSKMKAKSKPMTISLEDKNSNLNYVIIHIIKAWEEVKTIFLKVHRWIFRAISHRHTALPLKSLSDKNICWSDIAWYFPKKIVGPSVHLVPDPSNAFGNGSSYASLIEKILPLFR